MRGIMNRDALWTALIVVALLLSGCTKVGPDFVRPEATVSPNWLEVEDKRVNNGPVNYRNWWQVFNDPVLDRLIDQAYREKLDLRTAGVRVLEARAQLGIAAGDLYPQTQQASGSVQYNRISEHSPQAALSQAASSKSSPSPASTTKPAPSKPEPAPNPLLGALTVSYPSLCSGQVREMKEPLDGEPMRLNPTGLSLSWKD